MRLWKRLQTALVRLGVAGIVIAFIAGLLAAAYFAGVFPDWTGFGTKTLWDWLGLLLIPLVLAVGGFFLTRSENRYALQIQERREAEARKIEEQRAQDTALQAYLEAMTKLLLENHLRTSQPNDEVRSVARARTLTVLRGLDQDSKVTVLQFLYEAGLIGGIKEGAEGGVAERLGAVVILEGADLKGINLEWEDLKGINLAGADLEGVNLSAANLSSANLGWAHLEGACLEDADLPWACLTGAYLKGASLDVANFEGASLEGVNLEGASLFGIILKEASLEDARLIGANLEGANLEGADLTNCEVTREQLAQVDYLEGAKLPFDMTLAPAPQVKGAAQENQAPKDESTVEPSAGHPPK